MVEMFKTSPFSMISLNSILETVYMSTSIENNADDNMTPYTDCINSLQLTTMVRLCLVRAVCIIPIVAKQIIM
jgi:hypothetical protein